METDNGTRNLCHLRGTSTLDNFFQNTTSAERFQEITLKSSQEIDKTFLATMCVFFLSGVKSNIVVICSHNKNIIINHYYYY